MRKKICSHLANCNSVTCVHRKPHQDEGSCYPGKCNHGTFKDSYVSECRECTEEEELLFEY